LFLNVELVENHALANRFLEISDSIGMSKNLRKNIFVLFLNFCQKFFSIILALTHTLFPQCFLVCFPKFCFKSACPGSHEITLNFHNFFNRVEKEWGTLPRIQDTTQAGLRLHYFSPILAREGARVMNNFFTFPKSPLTPIWQLERSHFFGH
jgi:hypothetical protein